jgi:hypothetical protein
LGEKLSPPTDNDFGKTAVVSCHIGGFCFQITWFDTFQAKVQLENGQVFAQ